MQGPAGHGEDIGFPSNCSGMPLTVLNWRVIRYLSHFKLCLPIHGEWPTDGRSGRGLSQKAVTWAT